MPGRRRPLIERIDAKIDRTSHPGGCWIWTGALSQKRDTWRPVIQTGGRGSPIVSVARYLLALTVGPAPDPGDHAGHVCPGGEEALCVRPAHLQWMSCQENQDHKRQRRAFYDARRVPPPAPDRVRPA
jgi:hypothetical protein